MALQSILGEVAWPGIMASMGALPTVNSYATLDAAGEYVAFVFVAKQAMTISHIGFRAGFGTGSPTADIRVETIDAATGLPSGTLWATDTNIVTGTLVNNTFSLFALTAPASIAAGQIFAIKIAYNSGTTLVISGISGTVGARGLPYAVLNTGTPTKTALANMLMVLGSSTTEFYTMRGLLPVNTITNANFNNTDGAKRCMRFRTPFPCRVRGILIPASAQTGDFNIRLEDDAGNELSSSSTAFEGNAQISTNAGSLILYFDNPVVLAKDTWYRAAVEPSSSTNVNFSFVAAPAADYLKAFPGGQNATYASFASGAWTDTTDQAALMDILIDQFDDGVSAGGGAHVIGG